MTARWNRGVLRVLVEVVIFRTDGGVLRRGVREEVVPVQLLIVYAALLSRKQKRAGRR